MRRVIAALVVVGLAIAVFLLWPRTDPEEPPIGEATTTSSTSTTEPSTTTSTTTVTTTTTNPQDDRTVETVEEAEEILRELWFGWFEGIYNQDEERIREVVALDETVETAKESFGVEFEREPRLEDISFEGSEILRADEECLAVHATLVITGFSEGSSDGVEIVRWTSEGWKSLSTWKNPQDLWEGDCESSLP